MTRRVVLHLNTRQVLDGLGREFAVFDSRTQDSGHVSYGLESSDGRRWFAKTAGLHADSPGGTSYQDRVDALRRTAELHAQVDHPAVVQVDHVVETADGVVVVQPWFPGELLRSPPARRGDPAEASERFRALPLAEAVRALDAVIDLHVRLESAGWIAGDFYDGSLMYDFTDGQIKVIDLESYHRGAYLNDIGRLPGSTRYMAPEEHARGATIDARTTVFNLARMIENLMPGRSSVTGLSELTARATAAAAKRRPVSVRELQHLWRQLTS